MRALMYAPCIKNFYDVGWLSRQQIFDRYHVQIFEYSKQIKSEVGTTIVTDPRLRRHSSPGHPCC